jgi:hypothetical protein
MCLDSAVRLVQGTTGYPGSNHSALHSLTTSSCSSSTADVVKPPTTYIIDTSLKPMQRSADRCSYLLAALQRHCRVQLQAMGKAVLLQLPTAAGPAAAACAAAACQARTCAPRLLWPAMPATCGKCAPHWRQSSLSFHQSPTCTPWQQQQQQQRQQ